MEHTGLSQDRANEIILRASGPKIRNASRYVSRAVRGALAEAEDDGAREEKKEEEEEEEEEDEEDE